MGFLWSVPLTSGSEILGRAKRNQKHQLRYFWQDNTKIVEASEISHNSSNKIKGTMHIGMVCQATYI